MTVVNLIGAGESKLLNQLLSTYPSIQFTRQSQLSQINVIFGNGNLLLYLPGSNVNDHHCYTMQKDDKIIIPSYSLETQFVETDRTHWISHAIAKAVSLATGETQLDPPINYILEPGFLEAKEFLDRAQLSRRTIGIDIETIMGTTELTAIAVALSPTEAISIPFATYGMEPYWSQEQELLIWSHLASLLSSSVPKVFQNYIFDTLCLRRNGIETRGIIDDTLIISNLLNPELPKSLADLARLYCFCEPWKDKKDFSLTGNLKDFWRYNAQDAARTLQIYEAQLKELEIRKLSTFYEMHTKPLLPIVYDTCVLGIGVDQNKLTQLNEKISTLASPIEAELSDIAQPLMPYTTKRRNKEKDVRGASPKTGKTIVLQKGYDNVQETFNPNSDKQIKEILKTLGFRIPTKKRKETTDRQALLKLNRKQPHQYVSALLLYGKLQKLRSTYGAIKLDQDGRCHYSFNIGGTKSGRFSCQRTSWGTGLNIQTIPRKNKELSINFREIFIPDTEIFVQVDLSQAELRVVSWLAHEEKLTRMLQEGQDVHRFMSSEIERVLHRPANRDFGKFLNHATNYGVGANKLCDMALDKLDLSITQAEAQAFLDVRKRTFPMIYRWQDDIRAEIFRTRRLVSPHGRERFFYGMITDETIREALSFIPQATVVDILNDSWIALSREPGYNKDFFIHAQCHDSLLMSVKADKLESTMLVINDSFVKQEIIINGQPRTIPWDIQTGPSWGELS